jgi:DNA-binding response OmpR family regulator
MAELGRILVADDEETFLYSTADLLRREGYECDCVSDGIGAAEALRSNNYDLLIADIKMPGNPQLELIRDLSHTAEGMPVILVTGYPSLRSAIQSIQLPVAAYLVKPVDFSELLARVQISIEKFRVYQTICSMRQSLQKWHRDLAAIEEVLTGMTEDSSSSVVDAFVDLTFQNIVGALSDIKRLMEEFVIRNMGKIPHTPGRMGKIPHTPGRMGKIPYTPERIDHEPLEPCHLLNCPKLHALRGVLVETIGVLEKTKSAFKSKDLGQLREKLEEVFRNVL